METYERNYWSLYFDFINHFKTVKFNEFAVPLFAQFYRLINGHHELSEYLNSESLIEELETKIESKLEVQSFIDQQLNHIKSDELITSSNHNIAIHDQLLRIPIHVIQSHFGLTKNLVIRNNLNIGYDSSKQKQIVSLNHYSRVSGKLISDLKGEVYKIFELYRNHPIFSHPYFKSKLIEQVPIIIKSINSSLNFLEEEEVSCLILGSTNEIESRSLAIAGLKLGIPSICLQHGVIGLSLGYLPKIANNLAVYGQFEEELYKAYGVSDTQIFKIGHPRFDYINSNLPSIKKVKDKLIINKQKNTILVIAHHIDLNSLEVVISKLSKLRYYNIIIKPRGNIKKIKHNIKKKYPNVVITDKTPLHTLLKLSDIIVSYESTIVLEAMLASKPVFVYKTETYINTDYFDQLGDFYCDPSMIVEHIKKRNYINIYKNYRSEFVKKNYTEPIHKSGNRLVEIVKYLNGSY